MRNILSMRISTRGRLLALTVVIVLAVRVSWIHLHRASSPPGMEMVDLSEDGSISQDPSSVVGIDVAHRLALRHRGVWIFVIDETVAVLFLKRSEKTMTCPGSWSIVGEHTHFNETWEESALRGLEEELRLTPQQVSLHAAAPPQFLHLEYPKRARADNQWTQEFVARVRRRDVQVDLEENTESAWIALAEIPGWVSACPWGRCRSCMDAHNITRWTPPLADGGGGSFRAITGGVGGLIADSLEHNILPRLSDILPDLPP